MLDKYMRGRYREGKMDTTAAAISFPSDGEDRRHHPLAVFDLVAW